MNLRELLKGISYQVIKGSEDTDIRDIAYDSSDVRENDLFVCIQGTKEDGHHFLKDAVERGAAAVVLQERQAWEPWAREYGERRLAVILVPDSRRALACLSANYFSHPQRDMTLIGITGTKGKTTVSWMLKAILEADGHKTGLIGTNGAYIGAVRVPILNTTPPSYDVFHLLDRMRKDGCSHVVMEVSSQGLKMDRVEGLIFDYGIFTNISPDHIGAGEHRDFEEYLYWKSRLFRQCKMGIVNGDDARAGKIMEGSTCPFLLFGTDPQKENIRYLAEAISLVKTPEYLGSRFTVKDRETGETEQCELSIAGRFNVSNALAAYTAACAIGCRRETILETLKKVSVRGRVEMIYSNARYHLMIDYAHNAVSLESLLKTLREYEPGRIVCIFGCGGNRSRYRRFSMGEISGNLADLTIVTEDNSRSEGRFSIMEDIITGIKRTEGDYLVIPDRRDAIRFGMKYSQPGDFIILAGKGHEDYQEKNGVRIPFSEHEIVRELLVSM